MSILYDTYNYAESRYHAKTGPQLYPIAHTTQNTEIEIWIDEGDGVLVDAEVIQEKEERKTLIPCTEASASRSGIRPPAHPLFDKLMYLAGDYELFGGEKGDSFHKEYMENLQKWCNSEYANSYIQVVYRYLQKGTLISDLVQRGILPCDENGKVLKKWTGEKEEKPAIFQAIVSSAVPLDAFVRIGIESNRRVFLWLEKSVQNDFIQYYINCFAGDSALCYVTGETVPCSDNHPKKIRNTGDQAKLISANDTAGFTFRGRFDTAKEAAQVGYEVSQKAHNALKWLIERQGIFCGSKVIVAWTTYDDKLPKLDAATDEAFDYEFEEEWDDLPDEDTFAVRLKDAVWKYKCDIKEHEKAAIIGLDAATTGRLSITFYREYRENQIGEMLDHIEEWHRDCAWIQMSHKKGQKRYIGISGLKVIANMAFGTEKGDFVKAEDKLVALTLQRLFPCVVEGKRVPRDMIKAIFHKAIMPQHYKNEFHWDVVRKTACSLIKKMYIEEEKYKEECKLSVNLESENYSYNCGRMLAVAHLIEERALNYHTRRDGDTEKSASVKRETNAHRYMAKFADSPCKTWEIIRKRLLPYEKMLLGKSTDLQKMMGEIASRIPEERFQKNEKLDGCMLLGYDAQIEYYWSNRKNKNQEEKENGFIAK